jgi:nucleoid-associated protein YgaU
MGRFTGWLALIVILGGLGYVMYEDLKLRREHTAEPSAVSAGGTATPPEEVAATPEVMPAPAPARAIPPADAPQAATGPSDAPAPEGDRTVAAADTAAPAEGAETPPLAASDSAAPPSPSATDSSPEPAAAPPEESGTAPVADPTADAATETETLAEAEPEAAPPEPASAAAEPPADVVADVPPASSPPAEAAVIAEQPAVPDPVGAETESAAAEPDVSLAETEATMAPVPDGTAPEAAATADAPAATDEANDGAKVPPPADEPRAAAVADQSSPAEAVDPVADAPEAAPVETDVAVAPEGSPATTGGGPSPVSESSDLDHSLQASPTPDPEPDTVIAAIDPEADIDGRSPTADPAPLQPGAETDTAATVPTFDVVRVEKTGDAVIAGVAAPNAEIAIVSGANTLATATAGASGEWAIALEEPLPAGQYDLAIRATSEDGGTTVSDQRVAVLVPETEAEEPLVILNAPDGPSTVLQVPAATEPPSAVADADPPSSDGMEEPATAVIADGTNPEALADEAGEGTSPTADANDVTPPGEPEMVAAAEPTDSSPQDQDSGAPPETGAATRPDAAAAPSEPEVAAVGPEPSTDGGTSEASQTAPGPSEQEVAAVEPEAEPETMIASEPEPAPEPEPIVPVVVVTAVEAETSGALFVAGTAITPEVVRVYIDDLLLGEATPSPSGTWLIEVQRELPAGTYDVRADQVESGSGTVIARAEVPFERDIDVAILTPVAEAGGPAGAVATGTLSGPTTVIIKRRDNLWRISRQLYGKGVRWSTIYQANKDQIRNPRWIYPGQVFVLPEGNVAWSGEGPGPAAAE